MKIVFCDMDMRQAQRFLFALGETTLDRPAFELDFSHGYTALRSVLEQMPFITCTNTIYLCNSPSAWSMLRQAIVEEFGNSDEVDTRVYLLSNRCNLVKAIEIADCNERFKNREKWDFTADDVVGFLDELNKFVGKC